MPSRAAKTLIYAASASLMAVGGTLSLSPGWSSMGTSEPQYMSSDNPWSLASGTQQAEEADESSVYYHRCDAARAAGAAPMRIGEPGYRAALDADGDGIACEPYR